MNEQLRILENGNIAPCPYKEECVVAKLKIKIGEKIISAGCSGESKWCPTGPYKEITKENTDD